MNLFLSLVSCTYLSKTLSSLDKSLEFGQSPCIAVFNLTALVHSFETQRIFTRPLSKILECFQWKQADSSYRERPSETACTSRATKAGNAQCGKKKDDKTQWACSFSERARTIKTKPFGTSWKKETQYTPHASLRSDCSQNGINQVSYLWTGLMFTEIMINVTQSGFD